ncbi:hypothetical protein [Desulfovibrio sp. ZJ369]|uniref:hypothetical protein n=1 Tax=Desulfovibrio sp. ZJ369 TaxID=2709793 RepID=UPI0013EC4764|nr:hypothetical protein [Desulfovibrio sp. ZJ369]
MSSFDYRGPYGLLALWFLLVTAMLAASGYGEWRFLFLSASPALPRQAAPTPAAGQQNVRDLLTATQNPPPVLPASHAPAVSVPPAARPEVSDPQFEMDKTSFSAVFRLSVPGVLRRTAFQQSPAAWMVDLDGAWQRRGREEYRFEHPLIRKVRIIPRKDYLRFIFYYADKRHKRGPQPEADLRPDRLSVTFRR